VIILSLASLGLPEPGRRALVATMDSLTRYHLSPHEEGTWNVIDATTGGPAEVRLEDGLRVLYKLPRWEAEEWSKKLNKIAGLKWRKNPSR
jgi:hypothetical protein